MLFVFLMALILRILSDEQIAYHGFGMFKKMIKIHEGLPRFRDALPRPYFDRLQTQQSYLESSYQITLMQPQWLESLRDGLARSRKIRNIPWYNIQFMPSYIQAFAYIDPHVKNRDAYLTDGDDDQSNNKYQSDIVSIFLNLSAIPGECIKDLEISDEDHSTNLNQLVKDYVTRNPMKGMGKSGIDTWLNLYNDFLDERDKIHIDEAACQRVRAKKR